MLVRLHKNVTSEDTELKQAMLKLSTNTGKTFISVLLYIVTFCIITSLTEAKMSKACACTETKNYQSIFKEKEERNKDCALQRKE